MILSTLRFQLNRARYNPYTLLALIITALLVLYTGYTHEKVIQAIAYLSVMWLCAFLTDMYALYKITAKDFVVRKPKRESLIFLLCAIAGTLCMILRFIIFQHWDQVNGLVRLAIAVPMILFTFPIALAVIMLLMKYKPSTLGIKLKGLVIALPVIALLAITNRIVSPESLTWNQVMQEGGGIAGVLFSGIVVAGLSEEFFRLIGQTRLAALMNDKGMAWFITTTLWALMHAPKWYGESKDLTETLLSSVRIIPIGLMWGYITHRVKSILPAVLVHGTNYWGVQNF